MSQQQPAGGDAGLPPEFEEIIPGFVRYNGPISLDELPFPVPENEADYHWVFSNRELHRQYQGLVVAVLDRAVWGAGKTAEAAWDDAATKPGCPARRNLIFVTIWGMPGGPEANGQGKQGG